MFAFYVFITSIILLMVVVVVAVVHYIQDTLYLNEAIRMSVMRQRGSGWVWSTVSMNHLSYGAWLLAMGAMQRIHVPQADGHS